MESIITDAEKSLDKALEFYERNDVALGYRPSLRYTDTICPIRPDALACVKAEFEIVDKYIDFFYKNLGIVVWKGLYGLDISDEAVGEITRITKNRLPEVVFSSYPELMSEADIVIFEPYKEDASSRDVTMAHEVWHLIEKKINLLQEHPFIAEGTATYAMMKFAGVNCDRPLEDFDDYLMMMYHGSANIVQNYVKNSKNPYLAMLDVDLRLKIQKELLDRVKPLLTDKIKKMLEPVEMHDAEEKMLKQTPEFANLVGNLTAENIVRAYRQMGAVKLVDELQGQNLDGLIYWFKKFGF